MEKFNWISAKVIGTDEFVRVRQTNLREQVFITATGVVYDFQDLDFTQPNTEEQFFLDCVKENNKKMEDQQELMNKMLSSLDANAIADHKAKIDEREYWRKLRGNIFLEVTRLRLSDTKDRYTSVSDYDWLCAVTASCFNKLYEQDKSFFKDKLL